MPLSGINVLVGANNAGKSSFLNAIELLCRSARTSTLDGPLSFGDMPSFASFDSVLRRHWNSKTQRPSTIKISSVWSTTNAKNAINRQYDFECRSRGSDDSIVVQRAVYQLEGNDSQFIIERERDQDSSQFKYVVTTETGKPALSSPLFIQLVPIDHLVTNRNKASFGVDLKSSRLEVVNPSRPIPRSFYVLDDPNLASEDVSLLNFLSRLWNSKDSKDKKIRDQVSKSLETLGLTKYVKISSLSRKLGPRVVQIRVAPHSSRQEVTIAHAGFGVSQALPLAVKDARLNNGTLIVYQPEVHLHPFAQSRLADMFAQSFARGNQVFVETHSVDLMLRLQLLIASGKLDASDVSILCFERRNGDSVVSQMKFDSLGAPSRPWPQGFFDTSLNLARELTAARLVDKKRSKETSDVSSGLL